MNEVKDKKLKIRKSKVQVAYDAGNPELTVFIEQNWPGEFKPVDITDIIKNFGDVLKWHGKTEAEFNLANIGLDDDEVSYREQKLISRCLNEFKPGEKLDPSKPWYFPVFNRNSGSGFAFVYCDYWTSGTDVGERLCYKEARLARYAGETFPEKFKPFILDLSGGSKK